MIRRTLLLALGYALISCAAAQARTPPPAGTWITASRNLEVQIAPCGQALCGVVVRVLANHAMAAGQSQTAPAKVGLRLITNLRPLKANTWKGQLFNRENGKTYDCLVEPQSDGTLKIRAYVGLPVMGKDQIWQPTEGPSSSPR